MELFVNLGKSGRQATKREPSAQELIRVIGGLERVEFIGKTFISIRTGRDMRLDELLDRLDSSSEIVLHVPQSVLGCSPRNLKRLRKAAEIAMDLLKEPTLA